MTAGGLLPDGTPYSPDWPEQACGDSRFAELSFLQRRVAEVGHQLNDADQLLKNVRDPLAEPFSAIGRDMSGVFVKNIGIAVAGSASLLLSVSNEALALWSLLGAGVLVANSSKQRRRLWDLGVVWPTRAHREALVHHPIKEMSKRSPIVEIVERREVLREELRNLQEAERRKTLRLGYSLETNTHYRSRPIFETVLNHPDNVSVQQHNAWAILATRLAQYRQALTERGVDFSHGWALDIDMTPGTERATAKMYRQLRENQRALGMRPGYGLAPSDSALAHQRALVRSNTSDTLFLVQLLE